jgi:hypothetical protein
MTLGIPNAGRAEGKSWKLNWSVTRLRNEDRTLFFPRDSFKMQAREHVYLVPRWARDAEIFRRPEF